MKRIQIAQGNFPFLVDEQRFESEAQTITGGEIRYIAKIPGEYELRWEKPGADDVVVGLMNAVDLCLGPGPEHFRAVPPASM